MLATTDIVPVVSPASHIPGPPQGSWAKADYAALPEDGNRYELLNGVLYMTPSPNESHQAANGRFSYYLFRDVELAGLGRVYHPRFDVVLGPATTVQPDVIVVLHANLAVITSAQIEGGPDLVVEVASPSTATYDRSGKKDAYALAGVKEYWIADPVARTVELLVLENGLYRSLAVYQGNALLPSQVLPKLPVPVKDFFA